MRRSVRVACMFFHPHARCTTAASAPRTMRHRQKTLTAGAFTPPSPARLLRPAPPASGGARCTREDPALQAGGNALRGLHCNWVADGIYLAMARPWQANLPAAIEELKRAGVGLVLNLQEVSEEEGRGEGEGKRKEKEEGGK